MVKKICPICNASHPNKKDAEQCKKISEITLSSAKVEKMNGLKQALETVNRHFLLYYNTLDD